MLKREVHPYWNLSVTVVRAKIHQSYDYLSESDCYVILNLPTASARTYRTKTISNSNNPQWNEVFNFRVSSNIKNILEFLVYDDDRLMRDDLCGSIFFDINILTPEEKESKCFIMNKKTKDELWVEFELTQSSEIPRSCVSNGVLVAGPFSELNVEIKNQKILQELGLDIGKMMLKLKGAYKEDHHISKSSSPLDSLQFFINRDLETELGLISEMYINPVKIVNVDSTNQICPLKPLPAQHSLTVSLPIGEEQVDIQLQADDRSEEDLKVRLEFDISVEEKSFLFKRRKTVSRALQKALNLKPSKVPLVAVVCSGGGSRAMTGTFGSLKGLQKIQVLDAISYITGVSGSTWTLASLYQDNNWSKSDFKTLMDPVKREMSKSKLSLFTREQLTHYRKMMDERAKEGHVISLIDMWGLAIEYLIQGKEKSFGTLSDMQRCVSEGQNPLPIFTAVNPQKDTDITANAEWCEFTPYEVGFSKYGAYVPTQNFGSEYYLGHIVKKLPENRLPFFLGIWSSVFSINLSEIWKLSTGTVPSWIPTTERSASKEETDSKPSAVSTYVINPVTGIAQYLSNFMSSRPIVSQMYNFLRGFNLHKNYSQNSSFITWKDSHPDSFPNTMTPVDPLLSLVDSGFSINAGFPPVLRSHRKADVILSLNFSWDQDQFMVLKQTHHYCADRKIPFPKIDFEKVTSEPLKEVYVFEDKLNPEAPIVIHFPLVNDSFQHYKAPGVKRMDVEEKKLGKVDVDLTSTTSPYLTQNITYSPRDFQNLADLTCYNIENNKDVILNVLKKRIE